LRNRALQSGICKHFAFAGERVVAVDFADACEQIRARVYQKAFELLRREFGACARFWPRPRFEETGLVPEDFRLDFYWRKANLGLKIVGPSRAKNPTPGHLSLTADHGVHLGRRPGQGWLIVAPYELVIRAPEEFLRQVRDILVASGKYPRLHS
jgi:hypothetical protein